MRLGTRGSALALAQARLVADRLADASPGLEVELVSVRTSGDESRGDAGAAPPERGDKARFVKEIEDALLAGEVDLAVHSAKDVPSELPDGLAIVGVPERAAATDSLCGAAASVEELPQGARIGTASVRRRSQLLALRGDLDVVELRGNVDTRLRKLEQGGYDAIVLASAGLARLGLDAGTPLPRDAFVPAPGQGCLALESRADDERIAALAALVTDRGSLLRLTAERALVSAIGASCHTPVGAHAELSGDELSLSAYVGLPDGSRWIRDALAAPADAPGELGRAVAERLLAAGAAELLVAAEGETGMR